MLSLIARLKSRFDLYCCMSSQAVAGARSTKNGRFLKSLFTDVDVKDGAYNSTSEALAALDAFTGAVGLPRPTLFVMTAGSTGGFHCHWILDRAVPVAEWLKLAKALKEAAKRHKFTVDMNVIADAARVLRIPGTTNFKYHHRPPVTLYPSIVERDYSVDEIAGPLAPYMKATTRTERNATGAADAPHMTQSALLDGADLNENDDLTAGLFNFGEFKEAVEFLTRKGWFGAHKYDHMLGLAWGCGGVELTEPVHTDNVRALLTAAIDATGRNPDFIWRLYFAGLERTRERIRAGEAIVTTGTIFHWACEQGWASVSAAPAASRPRKRLSWRL